MADNLQERYTDLESLFKHSRFPLAFVDLDAFDHNVAVVAKTQKDSGKTIRVASKSVRCIELLRRIFEKGKKAYKGILAFTVEEAAFLFDNGFNDIVVAYPAVRQTDLDIVIETVRKGAELSIMADSPEHLETISQAGTKAGIVLNVCLDIDMSFRPLERFGLTSLHLGVRRSPLRTKEQVTDLLKTALKMNGIAISGLMGYEAQIASVNDAIPGETLKNKALRMFKKHSNRELIKRRGQIVQAAENLGINLRYVNGGGSGSLVSTGCDESVTEVTAGSAFFAPGLFHHFHEVAFTPAAFFGLQVARIPEPGIITCQGGGYIGSGEVNPNRLPTPVMPEGLSFFSVEGAGEVQTPLRLPENCPDVRVGAPIFFQHAKAGELCERFNTLYLIKNNKIFDTVPTYRGLGKAFL